MTQKASRSATLARCTKLAAAQHGVISGPQAESAGLSIWTVRRLCQEAGWHRLHPGVFALWRPADPMDGWMQRLTAAALWLGGDSAVSHRAGAILWGVAGTFMTPIELSTTGRRRTARPGLIIHHVTPFAADEVVTHRGLRVTSVARTLEDLAGVLDPKMLEAAVDSALNLRLITPEQIFGQLARPSAKPGRKALRAILGALPNVATESALETLVWRALLDAGLPIPERQYEVKDADGKLIARVDFAYAHTRVAIEADGYRYHSSPADLQRDRRRQNLLVGLGWVVYRVTWKELMERPSDVTRQISELISSRSRRARPI